MLSRRSILTVALVTGAALVPALAAAPQPFNEKAFAQAQQAGKPILIVIHASWCPTCKAQKPILSELAAEPKFKELAYFVIDFDGQQDLVKRFGAQKQSTLIAFRGATEEGRSVGDTNARSIAALLDKTL
jgi:thiol-disulfide isomerase/thioredoxin